MQQARGPISDFSMKCDWHVHRPDPAQVSPTPLSYTPPTHTLLPFPPVTSRTILTSRKIIQDFENPNPALLENERLGFLSSNHLQA